MKHLPALIFLLLLAACRGGNPSSEPARTDMNADPEQLWVDSVMRGMSVEERVGQIFMPATFTTDDPATVRRLLKYVADAKIGGVVFLRGDTASMHALTARLRSASRLPLLLAIDAEWGLGMRLRDAESFPHNSALADASQEQMRDYGRRVGRDAAGLGLNMVLGPVLDVAESGSVMADRSFGADPQRVAALGVAYARGVAESGVMPVGKHFPGHGATSTDSHRALPIITRSREELDSIDLLPFRRYIEAGLPALMAGHMAVPALSGDSTPASISPEILTRLLRGEMNFKGLTITDAMNMDALETSSGRYVATLLAGADIILVPTDTHAAEQEIMQALREGVISPALINDRCRRILLYKKRVSGE